MLAVIFVVGIGIILFFACKEGRENRKKNTEHKRKIIHRFYQK